MGTESKRFSVGCVHGRFQPFHLGHLEYILWAYHVSDILYIGLANPDPSLTILDTTCIHRHTTSANPFPYFVRMDMILGCMTEAGIDINRIRFVPFPINRPELLKYYVPNTAVHIITVYDEWGEKKVQTLNQLGLQTHALSGQIPKVATGTEVRALLRSGTPVNNLVPPFVCRYLENNSEYLWSEDQ